MNNDVEASFGFVRLGDVIDEALSGFACGQRSTDGACSCE